MSLYGIPFLLANLGAQTIYVIDQRLRDQAIPENKAERILGDICAVLFSENLWEQIMAPQDMYTQDSTRSVLEKIVHSSLIKLNATSMNKLYDLTLMVFKHQLLTCSKPSVLWTLTKKHIETIQTLVPKLKKMDECNASIARFSALVKSFTAGDWLGLRQVLLEFLRNKSVKITLLMNAKYQSQGGSLGSFSHRKDVDLVGNSQMRRFQTLREGQKRASAGKVALSAYAKTDLIVAPNNIVCNLYLKEQQYDPKSPQSAMKSPKTSPKLTPSPAPRPPPPPPRPRRRRLWQSPPP